MFDWILEHYTVIALGCMMSGYIVGLGAVTVIDLHGWFGRTSPYWSEATTRTHKITKPLIWVGLILTIIGTTLWFKGQPWWGVPALVHGLYALLLINGLYLSFVISPFLLRQEAAGEAARLLSPAMQRRVSVSFIISMLGWWGSFGLLIFDITSRLG